MAFNKMRVEGAMDQLWRSYGVTKEEVRSNNGVTMDDLSRMIGRQRGVR